MAEKPTRKAWMAVVQSGDEEYEQETELVTVEFTPEGDPRVIETSDGRRITLLEPVGA